MKKDYEKIGKFMCFVLRHKPEALRAGLRLSDEGWVNVDAFETAFDEEDIIEAVARDSKGRFELAADPELRVLKIRCLYGHSLDYVKIKREGQPLPSVLFHGTTKEAAKKILVEGLRPMSRQYVHMAEDVTMAAEVGMRYAKTRENLVILQINNIEIVDGQAGLEQVGEGIWGAPWVSPAHIEAINYEG